MKKLIFGAVALFLMASCTGGSRTEKTSEDSIRTADSIAQVQAAAEQAHLDSLRRDSIMQETIAQQFKNAITLTPGKKSKQMLFEHTDKIIDWPLTLVNNTNITLTPNDYVITYLEEEEILNSEGDLVMVKKNRTMKGPELLPGATATATIHDSSTEDIRNPKVKLLISKDEFAKRYREQQENK